MPSLALEANPLQNLYLTEKLTELAILLALMGAGLRIDRPFGWRRWRSAWRLLGIAMPLTIAAIGLLSWLLLGLDPSSALLLGAALAPTDPVLASDVEVGPPREGAEDEVRFALTAEAGLNDGPSLPFVYFAVALATVQTGDGLSLTGWLASDVLWPIAIAIALGWCIGRTLALVAFRLPRRTRLSRTRNGFVALGMTLFSYGLIQLLDGYGFIGVFVAASTFRNSFRDHPFHDQLYGFAEQIERLLMMVLLVCFGAIVAEASIIEGLDWAVVVMAALILLVIRPLCGWISLAGTGQASSDRAAIAFFGIRGLGSFYYLAFALGQADFGQTETLWATVSAVVLMSVVLHGTTVTPVMRHLDRLRRCKDG